MKPIDSINQNTRSWIDNLDKIYAAQINGKKLYLIKTSNGDITTSNKVNKKNGERELSINEITMFSLNKMRELEKYALQYVKNDGDKSAYAGFIGYIKERTLKVINAKENKKYSLLNHYFVAVAMVLSGGLYYWFKEKKELEKLRAAVALSSQHNESEREIFSRKVLHIEQLRKEEDLSLQNAIELENSIINMDPEIAPLLFELKEGRLYDLLKEIVQLKSKIEKKTSDESHNKTFDKVKLYLNIYKLNKAVQNIRKYDGITLENKTKTLKEIVDVFNKGPKSIDQNQS